MYQKYKNVEYVKPSGLELKDRLVGVQRVTKVTKGGRAFGFSAIVVVGDENGVVGHGLGKSKEVSEAIAKAVEDAKKNLVRIPLNGTTLPHEQKGKFGGARVFLQPATEGTGVIAGGTVRAVLESVGIHNVLSKSQGSSNPHNVVKATFDALLQLRSAKTVAEQYNVTVKDIRILLRKGKATRFSKGKHAYPGKTFRRDHKVAYVTLKAGDKIRIFDEEKVEEGDKK